METVTDFILGGSKISVDGDCSNEIKRCLFLGKKAMTNLDCLLRSRDITLQTKVRLVKAMVFPMVMYGCESWTIKKAECQMLNQKTVLVIQEVNTFLQCLSYFSFLVFYSFQINLILTSISCYFSQQKLAFLNYFALEYFV